MKEMELSPSGVVQAIGALNNRIANIDEGTRSYRAVLGQQGNSYRSASINLVSQKSRTVTLNSVKVVGGSDVTSSFTLVNDSESGILSVYCSNSAGIDAGKALVINVTIGS